ncbi:MAG: helix-turn-helix domain-containing protein [Mucilaginibacter sp.]
MPKKNIPVYNIDHLSLFKQKDILISRFAPYLAVHKNLHSAHKHSFYHLVMFTEGGGKHAIDFHTYAVKPFQIYFMIPGQVHNWSFEGNVDGYVVNFSDQFFQSFLIKPDYLDQFPFFSAIAEDSVIDLPNNIQAKVQHYFEELIAESESGLPFGLDMVKSVLLQLFYTIGRLGYIETPGKSSSHSYTLLKNFRILIEQHFGTLRLPKEYAELLYITPNHLNALSNDLVGMSAGDLIRNRIVLEAKRLLVNPDLDISEIAYKLNFEDNSYFSKFFKKQVGLTPGEFRKGEIKKVANDNNILK